MAATALRQAIKILRAGGVIVYPTDTAYALGGAYNRPSVIRRVLAIKGKSRRGNQKFTLVASSLAQVERHFRLSKAVKRIARQYWPGPFSIVVSQKFSIRVPASPVARMLARQAGVPLIATSANRSGGTTPYSVSAALRQLRGQPQPDLVVNAGPLPKQKTSTIVRVDGRGKVTVLRNGAENVPEQLTA